MTPVDVRVEFVRLLDMETGRPLTVPMVPGAFDRWWRENQHRYRHLATITEGTDMTVLVTNDLTLQPLK